jgi:hypothetical protein
MPQEKVIVADGNTIIVQPGATVYIVNGGPPTIYGPDGQPVPPGMPVPRPGKRA